MHSSRRISSFTSIDKKKEEKICLAVQNTTWRLTEITSAPKINKLIRILIDINAAFDNKTKKQH